MSSEPGSKDRCSEVLAAARRLTAAGQFVVPIPAGQKGPVRRGWQEARLTEAELALAFAGAGNVGLLLGVGEPPLLDLDLDCAEARAAAAFLLPRPAARHGRESSREAHWWYAATRPVKSRQFLDPVRQPGGEGAMLCELRGEGGQTVIPPSRHPSGQALFWEGGEPLSPETAERWEPEELSAHAARVAACALLARYWPRGARHQAALALAGGLLRAGLSEEDARALVAAVARAAGDDEEADRRRAVADTARALDAGEEVTGWPRLRELLGEPGEAVVRSVTGWLGIESDPESVLTWPDKPRPFVTDHLPEFPVDCLPEWLSAMVKTVAETTQTPPDVAGLIGIAALALGVQRKVRVAVRSGWIEPLSIYAACAQESGARKSPVFRLMTTAIFAVEAEELAALSPSVERRAQERRVAAGWRDSCEQKATRGASPEERLQWLEEASRASAELAALPEIAPPRFLCQDTTEEALGLLLARHDSRMGIFDSEGGIFELIAGRYSDRSAVTFDLYLKAHSGENFRLDRATRGSLILERVALTIALTVQPSVIADLGRNRAFENRGLLARFLYGMPAAHVGFRNPDPPVLDEAVAERYARELREVLLFPQLTDASGQAVPTVLTLCPLAYAALTALQAWREPQLQPSGALADIRLWASKLEGHVVRLAALFHLAEHAPRGACACQATPISFSTWQRAEAFVPYLIAHARAAFHTMRVADDFGEARVILDWIEKREAVRFCRGELFDSLRGLRFPRAESLERALALLVEYGYLRRLPDTAPGPRGGRPSTHRFAVHPALGRDATVAPIPPEHGSPDDDVLWR